MAQTTMMGGVVNNIAGGKAVMGGAIYNIEAGKALVGGTEYEISFLGPPPDLNDMTWEEIREVSDAGLASSYFSVGDRKAVALAGTVGALSLDTTVYCYIIGIDHNSSYEGSNRIHFQFGYTALSGGKHIAFVDSGYNSNKSSSPWFNMNKSSSNAGGWESSLMRTVICPAFKSVMPLELQAVLKTVTKYSDNAGGNSSPASNVTATNDTVFLLSEYEVFGRAGYANDAEQAFQTRYAWYASGNPSRRYRHNSISESAYWWLRSVQKTFSSNFCYVGTSSSASGQYARRSLGFAPAFCV